MQVQRCPTEGSTNRSRNLVSTVGNPGLRACKPTLAGLPTIVANAGVSEVSPLVCRCFNQKARQCLTNFGVLLFGHPPPPPPSPKSPNGIPGMLWATGGKTISPVAPGASKRTKDTHQSGSKTCSRSVGRGGGQEWQLFTYYVTGVHQMSPGASRKELVSLLLCASFARKSAGRRRKAACCPPSRTADDNLRGPTPWLPCPS